MSIFSPQLVMQLPGTTFKNTGVPLCYSRAEIRLRREKLSLKFHITTLARGTCIIPSYQWIMHASVYMHPISCSVLKLIYSWVPINSLCCKYIKRSTHCPCSKLSYGDSTLDALICNQIRQHLSIKKGRYSETQDEIQLKSLVCTVFWCCKLKHQNMDLVYENKVFQVIGNIDCLHIIRSTSHVQS